ncbi:MAG: FGGY family carbohydrate kinase, partial [Acidimicrobiales bacterium]
MTLLGDVLVIDVGTSSVRAAVVHPDATVDHVHQRPLAVDAPGPGLAEVDARRLADAVLETAAAALSDAGRVDGVGVAAQRATTVVWDRATGEPVAPAIGWQDLRTVGTC